MADFLLFLGKLNLAIGAAIIVVYLFRRPLRARFGAPIAYALWLLVPVAALAILLPPRTEAPLPAHVTHLQNLVGQNPTGQYPAAQMRITMPIAQPAPRIPEQLTEHLAPVQSMIAAQTASLDTAFFDYAALLLAGWVLGTVLMALYLARLQHRFHATMRSGEAGPAVLGFFRPRLVMPDSFQEQFTAPEQAAILAHERVHLARQDARINALAALLRCLCWFNPLVHLGAAWLRIDQELACDATALAGPVSRRDYANALLKSQMMTTLLPLGCNWPGSQHPLIERIALLKRKRPGTARRIAGTGLVVLAATFAGLGAWAAQPPLPAKIIASPHNQIGVAKRDQNAGDIGAVANANPINSGPSVNAQKTARTGNPISAAPPADAQRASADSKETQSAPPAVQDSLPEQKMDLALNQVTGAVAQRMPAGGAIAKEATDPVSAMAALSLDRCQPIVGTLIIVHGDPAAFATDVVLDDILPASAAGPAMQDKEFTALIPMGNVKDFPALESYVGQKVAIWPVILKVNATSLYPHGILNQITRPLQLRPLSAALADPKKTWCYLPPAERARILADRIYAPPAASTQSASEASPGAVVTPVVPVQPAKPEPSAEPVVVTAATPAEATDPFAGMGTLVNGKCQPIADYPWAFGTLIVGTVVSVHPDPAHFGTDIVLDHILPKPNVTGRMRDGYIVALVPADSGMRTVNGKPLDTLVGQKVSIWAPPISGVNLYSTVVTKLLLLCDPSQGRRETNLLPNDASAPAMAAAMDAPLAARAQSASEASPAVAVMLKDQLRAPVQPATSDPSVVPVAAVNDEFISDYELRQRMALFISLSDLKPNADALKRIRGQILDQMKNEEIELQEAVRKHITVSPVEVDRAVNNLLSQKHLTMDQLRSLLNQAGASEQALRSQITAQIAWQKTGLAAQINTQVNKQNFSIRIVDENVGKDALQSPADDERVRMAHLGDGALWLKRKGQIDGDVLADASVSNDSQTGKPVIDFQLTPKGRDQFAERTRENIGHRLAVVVNGTVVTAPTVITPILGGRGRITGDFATEAEAKALAAEMMGTNHPVKP